MKRIISILFCSLSILVATAQVPTDTGALRTKINTNIVTNGSKQITAVQLNQILNGITTLMTKYSLTGGYRVADTLFLTGPNVATVRVVLNTGGAPSETDPTVPAVVKGINGSDTARWNRKMDAQAAGAGIIISGGFIQAERLVAEWNADKLQGRSISVSVPSTGQVLKWNGSAWAPASDSVGAGGGSGVPNGGTTNQALVKNSNADGDVTYSTINKSFVGLSNVDNTSDANKPVSTAQQTAINLAKDSTFIRRDSIFTAVNVYGAAIPFGSFRNKKVRLQKDMAIFSNSYGAEYLATSGKGYPSIFGSRMNVTLHNYSASGRGIWMGVQQANEHVQPTDSMMGFVDLFFNDGRRNSGNNVLEKLGSGTRSIICSFLAKTITSGNGLTKSGSWTSADFTSYGGRSTTGAFATSNGAYVEFTFTGDAVIFGYLNRITSSFAGGNIDVKVDGSTVKTVSATATDGISDGTYDNQTMAGAIILTGLGSGSHTLRLTKSSGDYIYIDYCATVKSPAEASPLVLSLVPKMNATGYAISPSNASDALFNRADSVIMACAAEVSEWDVSIFYPNDYINPYTADANADNIHLSDQGHLKWANGLVKKFYITGSSSAGGSGTQDLQSVVDNGATTDKTIITAGAQFKDYEVGTTLTGKGLELAYDPVGDYGLFFAYDRDNSVVKNILAQALGGAIMIGGNFAGTYHASELLNVQGDFYTTGKIGIGTVSTGSTSDNTVVINSGEIKQIATRIRSTFYDENSTNSRNLPANVDDSYFRCAPGGTNMNLTVGAQTAGQRFTVVKTDSGVGTITVFVTSGTINAGLVSSIVLSSASAHTTLVYDGANYLVVTN